MKRLTRKLQLALEAARNHLEYTGYGDKWERECAQAEGLAKEIEEALSAAEKLLGPTPKDEGAVAMTKTTEILVFNSEKKHSVRYDGGSQEPVATSIYIMKTALGPAPYPRRLKLTIEVVEIER